MPKKREQLVAELAELIITSVNLKGKHASEILPETTLTSGGLSLDSLDILEIAVAVEQNYKVKIGGPDEGREIFKTVGSLADFVQSHSA